MVFCAWVFARWRILSKLYLVQLLFMFFLINIANNDLKIDILLLIQTKLYPGFRRSLTSKRRHKMHVIQNAKMIFSCYISSFSFGRKLEGLVRKNFVVVVSGLTLLSTIFQSYHDGVWLRQGRELNAHFYSAASLKNHAPDTWHDTTPSHIILTLGRPVLTLPRKSECQAMSN